MGLSLKMMLNLVIINLIIKLMKIEQAEKDMLKQKSRVKWSIDGDDKSSLIH